MYMDQGTDTGNIHSHGMDTDKDHDMDKAMDTDTWHGHGDRNFVKVCTYISLSESSLRRLGVAASWNVGVQLMIIC
jgi:hypothetical protein